MPLLYPKASSYCSQRLSQGARRSAHAYTYLPTSSLAKGRRSVNKRVGDESDSLYTSVYACLEDANKPTSLSHGATTFEQRPYHSENSEVFNVALTAFRQAVSLAPKILRGDVSPTSTASPCTIYRNFTVKPMIVANEEHSAHKHITFSSCISIER